MSKISSELSVRTNHRPNGRLFQDSGQQLFLKLESDDCKDSREFFRFGQRLPKAMTALLAEKN